jgi:DMSO/TMAO reductase YedYZ molybdopterin-dependent catalytic subunit
MRLHQVHGARVKPPGRPRLRWSAGLTTTVGAGYLGGLALAGAFLWLRLLGGPSLLDVLQLRLLAVLPGPLTSALIDTLGFQAKPLLLGGVVFLLGLMGALLAVAARVAVKRLRWRSATAGAAPGARNRMLGRRRGIALLLTGGVTAFTGTAMWRVVADFGERETPLEDGMAGEITANDRFYVVSQNLVDPDLDAAQWTLDVVGLVNAPLRLTYRDLLGFPAEGAVVTLECISNAVGGKLISNARWTGVPLAAVLERAGLRAGAVWVVFRSTDDYEESIPLSLALQDGTLLAHTMNGAPLPRKHGYPVRALVAGRYGMKSPKWLKTIEVSAAPLISRWERTGWDGERGVATMARLNTRPHRVTWGEPIPLAGIAFAGDRGIAGVEVSVDGGTSWMPAELRPSTSRYAWKLWQLRWTPPAPSRRTLVVRATDGNGVPQVSTYAFPFPSGATGYDTWAVYIQ